MEYINLLSLSISSIAIICTYVYYSYMTAFTYWKKKGIKYVPNPIPLFGNSFDTIILKKISRPKEQVQWYNSFPEEKYFGFFIFKIPFLVLRDPCVIQNVLTKDFSYFYNRGVPYEEKIDKLSSNLVNLKDEKWKNLRKKLTPAFSSSKLKIMFESLNECANEMDKYIDVISQTTDVFDVREAMAKFSTDVIGSCAFGLQFNSLKDPDSEFRKVGRQLFKPNYRFLLRFLLRQIHPKLITLFKIKIMDPKIEAFFLNFVKDSVEYREKNNIQKKDFFQLLIDLRKEDASGSSKYVQNKFDSSAEDVCSNDISKPKTVILDDQLMASNMFIFFIAGFETTSSTMSYCLLELAANPEIQEKLVTEILSTLESNDHVLNYDIIKNMPFMEMVIKETLRKYPIAYSLMRQCSKSYQFPGTNFTLEKDRGVIIPVYALHHDPQYYPDPEKFNPERFSDDNINKIPTGAYLPFGDGPRICIGMRLAMMEMKTAFCKILPHYRFEMSDKMQYPIEFDKRGSPLLTPKDGIWLKLYPRDKVA